MTRHFWILFMSMGDIFLGFHFEGGAPSARKVLTEKQIHVSCRFLLGLRKSIVK